MGHTLDPTLNQILKLVVIPDTQDEAIVIVNGQKYKFTILKDTTDITKKIDGAELATRVTEFFLKDTGRSSIDTGEIVLSGDFDDIETATTVAAKRVSLISSTVQYTEGTESKEKVLRHDSITPDAKIRVDQHLKIIGDAFASIRPISSPPSNSISLPTNPPLVDLTDVDLIQVDASGQCADSSLTYQMLTQAKQTDLLTSNKPDVDEGAKYLRKAAAQIIENDKALDNDPAFINCLRLSISHIPGLQDSIKDALKNNDKLVLRTFYASYITAENAGQMSNFLDGAFFYVLPQINVPTTPNLVRYFPNGFHCAIVQKGAIVAQYPVDADWTQIGSSFGIMAKIIIKQ